MDEHGKQYHMKEVSTLGRHGSYLAHGQNGQLDWWIHIHDTASMNDR